MTTCCHSAGRCLCECQEVRLYDHLVARSHDDAERIPFRAFTALLVEAEELPEPANAVVDGVCLSNRSKWVLRISRTGMERRGRIVGASGEAARSHRAVREKVTGAGHVHPSSGHRCFAFRRVPSE